MRQLELQLSATGVEEHTTGGVPRAKSTRTANARAATCRYEVLALTSNPTRILRVVNKGKDGCSFLSGVYISVADDGEQVMARIHNHLRTIVWPHPRMKARGLITVVFWEIEVRLAMLDPINPSQLEMLPHPVPIILGSHERSEGLTEAFHRPSMIRGSVAFILREQHAALHGDVEPRMAILFAEKLNYRRIGWLILVNFLLCVGVGGIAYGLTNHSAEAALTWLGGFGTLFGAFQGLIFWLFR
ncbi:hypothetical protein B0T25DRAFT_571622 [Lasiosphaeria hispida]|uniref:Uncharacterized protein n=1 Tax=Lasiosphaeria hispida TaxID=260671 RepID=A0AAJ0MAP2_9PEZI|nr:hypothetical protein B0T25DRAFT_571622 [Lasiosphaeria hispida]